MSAFSLDLSPPIATRRVRQRGWLVRVLAAIEESRMRSARATLARHSHLLPAELEHAGDRLTARSEPQLPLVGAD